MYRGNAVGATVNPSEPELLVVPLAPPIELVGRMLSFLVGGGGPPSPSSLDRVPLVHQVGCELSDCPDGSTYFVSRPWFDDVYRPLAAVKIRKFLVAETFNRCSIDTSPVLAGRGVSIQRYFPGNTRLCRGTLWPLYYVGCGIRS